MAGRGRGLSARRLHSLVLAQGPRCLTRAQETILEGAAQAWMIVSSLDDWIARQPTLVTKKRALLPVVVQRMQMAEGLARNLERLGLERQANRPMRA